jgi:ketosteroid isomerase-like protein
VAGAVVLATQVVRARDRALESDATALPFVTTRLERDGDVQHLVLVPRDIFADGQPVLHRGHRPSTRLKAWLDPPAQGVKRAGDGAALADVLTGDFIFVDLMRGAELTRADLVTPVFRGQLRFDTIDVVSSRVRCYGAAAIVTGRTDIRGRACGSPWAARSWYTHVYVEQNGHWRLASAQGTQMTASEESCRAAHDRGRSGGGGRAA